MASRRFFDRLRRRGLRGAPGRAALDLAPGLPERDAARVRDVITELLRLHDTMTQRAEAAAVADAYVALSDDGRRNFLLMLAHDFWTDPRRGRRRDRRAASRRPTGASAERRLRDALVPPADRLLRLFTGLEGGVKFLVDLRADVLRVASGDAALGDLDRELKAHLATLFDVGLLDAAPHHVGGAGRAAREADRVRGGARDRLVGRPEEPARLRPPLLRVLPSRDAERAARVRRDRAHRRHRHRARAAARRAGARARPRARRHRGVLFDLQLPARASRASTSAPRSSSRSSRRCASTCRSCAASSRCRRSPAFAAWVERELGADGAATARPANASCCPRSRRACSRGSSDAGVGRRRGDPARAAGVVRALPHDRARGPRRRPGRELPSRQRRVGRAHQLDGRLRRRPAGPARSA